MNGVQRMLPSSETNTRPDQFHRQVRCSDPRRGFANKQYELLAAIFNDCVLHKLSSKLRFCYPLFFRARPAKTWHWSAGARGSWDYCLAAFNKDRPSKGGAVQAEL
jgi:hypothetical protein